MSTESVLFVLIMIWWHLTVCGRSGNMLNSDKAMRNLSALYHQVKRWSLSFDAPVHIVSGSRSLQCNSEGKCQCKPGVTGKKCDRCEENYYDFSSQGCKPCGCNSAGSRGNQPRCDPYSGICQCKENVEGKRCGGWVRTLTHTFPMPHG